MVLFWWTGLDPQGFLDSELFRERSAPRGKLPVLVSVVLRMVHRVLVKSLGLELESDLNL